LNEPLTVVVDQDIVDLAESFLTNRRGQIGEWRAAVANGNGPALSRLGHELKGTAGAFGFRALSDLGTELEQAVAIDNLQGAGDTLERMIDYLDRVAIVPR
jgi:HPt (histidine-containing phosphotransfer) domain-containing protein